jgi:hypothetical protein
VSAETPDTWHGIALIASVEPTGAMTDLLAVQVLQVDLQVAQPQELALVMPLIVNMNSSCKNFLAVPLLALLSNGLKLVQVAMTTAHLEAEVLHHGHNVEVLREVPLHGVTERIVMLVEALADQHPGPTVAAEIITMVTAMAEADTTFMEETMAANNSKAALPHGVKRRLLLLLLNLMLPLKLLLMQTTTGLPTMLPLRQLAIPCLLDKLDILELLLFLDHQAMLLLHLYVGINIIRLG